MLGIARSTRLAAAAIAALALTLTGVLSATAAPRPGLSDKELITIGQSGTLEDLKALSGADLERYIELSQPARVTTTESRGAIREVDGQKAVEEGLISVPEGGVVPLSVICKTASRTATSKNALGNTLNTRTLQIQVCGNYGAPAITSHSITAATGQVYWLGWTYNGVLAQGSATVAGPRANHFAQYSFTYFLSGVPLNYNYCVSLDSAGITSSGSLIIYSSPTARCSV